MWIAQIVDFGRIGCRCARSDCVLNFSSRGNRGEEWQRIFVMSLSMNILKNVRMQIYVFKTLYVVQHL
jgi:hypothetical protein